MALREQKTGGRNATYWTKEIIPRQNLNKGLVDADGFDR